MTITTILAAATTQPAGSSSDILKIMLTAVIGAVLGIFTFTVGQVIQKTFIEPIQAQRQIVGKIAHAMTYLLNISQNPLIAPEMLAEHNASLNKASDTLRQLASDLRASTTMIPMYARLERFGWVVSRRNVGMTCYLLMTWHLRMESLLVSAICKELHAILKIDFGNEAAGEDINKWVKDNSFLLGIHMPQTVISLKRPEGSTGT